MFQKGFKAGYVMKSLGPCSSPVYYLTELLASVTPRESVEDNWCHRMCCGCVFCQTGSNSEMETI